MATNQLSNTTLYPPTPSPSPTHPKRERSQNNADFQNERFALETEGRSEKIAKIYSVNVSPNSGKIRMHASPSSKKKTGVYKIFNAKSGEAYIGKTNQGFQKRLSQHASCANSVRKAAPIYQALRSSPSDFRFTLLEETPSSANGLSQSSLEKEHIKQIEKNKRLNCNRGGGGGTSRKSAPHSPTPDSAPELLTTPVKYFPLKRNGEKAALTLTPRSGEKEGTVYVIKDQETDERYVGASSQKLKKRAGQHISQANTGSGSAIHAAIRENPERFAFGILALNVPLQQLAETERHYIHEKDSIEHGFNLNGGGGGSCKSS